MQRKPKFSQLRKELICRGNGSLSRGGDISLHTREMAQKSRCCAMEILRTKRGQSELGRVEPGLFNSSECLQKEGVLALRHATCVQVS